MFPAQIKAELVLRGITIASIARGLGKNRQNIHAVISGRLKTAFIRQAIAEAIGRSVSEVFPEDGSQAGKALDRTITGVEQVAAERPDRLVETLESVRKIPGATVRPIPLLGKVPAGPTTEAVEERIAMLRLPVALPMSTACYALLIEGDSMSPELVEGDVVIVSERPPASGDLAVVQMTETYEATIKRVRFQGNRVILEPVNPRYPKPSVARKKIARLHKVEAVYRAYK